MKKLLPVLLCALFLTSCSANRNVQNDTTNNTTSNITPTTTVTENDSTEPTAKAVAGIESLSQNKVIWGSGNIQNHTQPAEPVKLNQEYFDLDGRWLLDDKKSICLTFDEGYENGYTPSILDTLKQKQVQAVFFVTYDFAKDNPDLIQRMLDEGHIVGNHSYRHYSMDELDTATAKEEIEYLHKYIEDNFNYTMSYFRFPKGEFSEKSLAIAQSLGYTSVFWSFAYADWDPAQQADEATALANICESTHPGEIMLLHAVSKTNAAVLGRVIDDVRQQGYNFTVQI